MAGCGGKGGGGPTAVVSQFDEAMKSGDLKKAAELFEYDSVARGQNSDWDTFGVAQRKLITEKLQDDKAKELEPFQSAYASAGYQVGEAQIQGPRATVTLTGTNATLTITLVQDDGDWRIQIIR